MGTTPSGRSGRRHGRRRRRRGRRRLCLVCQPRGSRRGGALPPPSGGRRLPLRKAREPRDTGASPRGRRRSAATYRPHPAPPSQQPRSAAAPFTATHPPGHPHGRRDGAAGPHLSTEGWLGRVRTPAPRSARGLHRLSVPGPAAPLIGGSGHAPSGHALGRCSPRAT